MTNRGRTFTLAAVLATGGALATGLLARGTAPPEVSVADVNPGTSVERDLCLSVSLAPGAASECGDLRLAHALPAVRTLNRARARAPVLLYNSQHASPHPIVTAHVTLPSGPSGLSRVVATLKVNGTPRGQGVWKGSAWPGSGPVRIAVGYDAASDSTGPYRYTLEVRAHYGETMLADTARGELVVVNRRESVFGAGWWLAGLERLVLDPFGNPVLWVGGDGSTRRYTNAGGGDVWGTPSLDRPDSIKKTAAGWERILGGGVKVEFDAAGRHVATVNRLTHRTEFRYDSEGRVEGLTIPRSVRGFSFHYATDGRLERAESPGAVSTPRVTHLHRTGSRVDSIREPDGSRIRFGYADAARSLVPTSRANAAGVATRFRFDRAGLLAGSRIDPNATDSIVMRLRAVESLGLATTAGTGALDTARAYALIDGPRTDVGDSTRLWLDRWGAPRRVVDALGHETLLTRGNPAYPALVTRMRQPNGMLSAAGYDRRGNRVADTVFSPFGEGDAVTRYAYDDPAWPDFATRIVRPERDSTVLHYDARGNRTWQQAGPDSTRVYFSFDSVGQVETVRSARALARGEAPQRFEYDATAGNFLAVISPLGIRSESLTDALGQVVRTRVPLDDAGQQFQTDSVVYDLAGRVEQTIRYGPPTSYALSFPGRDQAAEGSTPAERAYVRNFYGPAGVLDSVSRWSDPDLNQIGVITSSWRYDAAGRRVAELAPGSGTYTYTIPRRICSGTGTESCETVEVDTTVTREHKDSTRYDAAGNVLEVVTRRGHSITMEYDALNRLMHRRLPAVGYGAVRDSSSVHLWHFPLFVDNGSGALDTRNPGGAGLVIPADVESYTYDAMGNVLTAVNRDAVVKRSYHPAGALETDTLRIRHYAGPAMHAYGLAYRYDLNGRRTELLHPANIAPRTYEYDEQGAISGKVVHDRQSYTYHPETGALKLVTGAYGDGHLHEYDAEGRLAVLARTAVEEVHRYDADGRLTFRGQGPSYRLTAGTPAHHSTHEDSLVHDARGKVVQALSLADETRNAYSGLGMLAMSRQRFFAAQDPDQNFIEPEESYLNDALGNVAVTTRASRDRRQPMEWVSPLVLTHRYEARTGRQIGTDWNVERPNNEIPGTSEGKMYDDAGNLRLSRRHVPTTVPYERCKSQIGGGEYCVQNSKATLKETILHYYGPDQRLRVVDRRTCLAFTTGCDMAHPPPPEWWPAFEEYRYDALGRRVLVRSRPEWLCAGRCSSTLRRTIWDGDQVLYEITARGKTGTAPHLMERDTALEPSFRSAHFPFGRVVYTHGTGIDRPLALTRMEYSDSMPQPVTIVPLATWKGTYDTGYFPGPRCVTLSTQSVNVLPVDTDYPSNTYDTAVYDTAHANGTWEHCIEVDWPAPHLWASKLSRPRSVLGPISWMGGLIDGMRDASGQIYMRNRYYDPSSGRFTQEDPIGLAGGINLYGFANGDPVGYSDPFGLKVCYQGSGAATNVAATEQASGTIITLDADNCIKSIVDNPRARGYRGLGEVRRRLRHMAFVTPRTYYVKSLTEGRATWADFGREPFTVRIGVNWESGPSSPYMTTQLPIGGCLPPSAPGRLPALIAHELLGHAYWQDTHGHNPSPSGEPYARRIENVYHEAVDEPRRCTNPKLFGIL